MTKKKLAIVTSHPIQYYAPVFRALAASESVDLQVFYTWPEAQVGLYDVGFGTVVNWDLPLLAGYPSRFVKNVARNPGSHHFWGLLNPTLIAEIERWGAEAVLVFGWRLYSHLQVMRHFSKRIGVLFRGDSTLLDDIPLVRKHIRRTVLRWVYSHVDTAIAVGSNSRDYFVWCGLSADRISFAPHSVDTDRFADESSGVTLQAERWRSELGIDPQAVVFLFAGKFQGKKNPGLLLNAFRALNDGTHLIFLGSGELEAELRQRASEISRVHFLPFQNQSAMPRVYRLGDVFILPSKGPEETWGLSLNEAMASGRALIASQKVGGARDLVQHGVNGWQFRSESLDSLRAVLAAASKLGREGLSAMGKRGQLGRDRWSTRVSARLIAKAVEDCKVRNDGS